MAEIIIRNRKFYRRDDDGKLTAITLPKSKLLFSTTPITASTWMKNEAANG
jgi:hypothetical protein